MNILNDRSISTKILAIVTVMGILIALLVFVFYYFDTKDKIIQATVQKTRALNLNLENFRSEIHDLWSDGTITPEVLKQYGDNGVFDKVLNAIPIVSTWQAAQKGEMEGWKAGFIHGAFETINSLDEVHGSYGLPLQNLPCSLLFSVHWPESHSSLP